MKKPTPLIDARIYPGQRRRGRYARLLVFVTKRELHAYLTRRKRTALRDTAAMCTAIDRRFHVDRRVPSECFAEMVFSAGFGGIANEIISHECLHALLILRTKAQVVSALGDMADEERFLAYPLGRLVRRSMKSIYDVEDGIAFMQPRGNALKKMRLITHPTRGNNSWPLARATSRPQ